MVSSKENEVITLCKLIMNLRSDFGTLTYYHFYWTESLARMGLLSYEYLIPLLRGFVLGHRWRMALLCWIILCMYYGLLSYKYLRPLVRGFVLDHRWGMALLCLIISCMYYTSVIMHSGMLRWLGMCLHFEWEVPLPSS